MSRRQILWCVLLALLAPGALMLMGNMQGCLVPLEGCVNDIEVTVPPGGSTSISNPRLNSDGEWTDFDGLYLADPPEGLSVVTESTENGTTRKLSANASIGALDSVPVSYTYSQYGTAACTDRYLVTTGTPLEANAVADPISIEPGETSDIDLTVTGGSGNNTFDWSPADGLDDPTVEDPKATPPFTRTYTVAVTDNNTEQTATASVTIEVNTGLTVTANPPVIDPGSSSQLSAVLSGAVPPVDYSWTPADSLDDATIQSPLASPTVNTTYQVNATDSSGGTPLSGEVTVTVNLTAVASATPDTINEGNASQLLATVQGGQPPYSFVWTPNSGLDANNVANPTASPTTTTIYTVDVTDSATTPQTSSDMVTVTVIPPPGGVLTACFTTIAGTTPLVLDASCTDPGVDGPIVQYCWWFNWDEIFRGTPIDTPAGASFCSTTQATANVFGEPGSEQIVRLRVEDSAGALAEDIQTVVF